MFSHAGMLTKELEWMYLLWLLFLYHQTSQNVTLVPNTASFIIAAFIRIYASRTFLQIAIPASSAY